MDHLISIRDQEIIELTRKIEIYTDKNENLNEECLKLNLKMVKFQTESNYVLKTFCEKVIFNYHYPKGNILILLILKVKRYNINSFLNLVKDDNNNRNIMMFKQHKYSRVNTKLRITSTSKQFVTKVLKLKNKFCVKKLRLIFKGSEFVRDK